MSDTDRITALERLAESLTAQIAALKTSTFGVGSWVELTEDFSPWAKEGAQGIVAWPSTGTGSWVDFKYGEYEAPGHWSCPNYKLRQIDEPKPAAPEPLKYKVGDYVLMPMRVDTIDPSDIDGRPYRLTNLYGTSAMWTTRATLEPSRPQVGQRVVADDGGKIVIGKLSKIDADDNDVPYLVQVDGEYDRWFSTAYTLPD